MSSYFNCWTWRHAVFKAHGCIYSSKPDNLGAGNAASVRQPTFTPILAGSASTEYQTVDPHWGQKWNIAPPPRLTQLRYLSWSASSFGTFHDVEAPWISTCSFGKRACTAKTFPDCFWHRWQWHKLMRSGSGPVIFKVSCPQLHVASRPSAFFVPLGIALAERPDLASPLRHEAVSTWGNQKLANSCLGLKISGGTYKVHVYSFHEVLQSYQQEVKI